IPKYNATAARKRFYTQVLSRTRALPGVTKAAYTSFIPISPVGGIWEVAVDERDPGPRLEHAMLRFVTPKYFSAMSHPAAYGTRCQRIRCPRNAVCSSGKRELRTAILAERESARASFPVRFLRSNRGRHNERRSGARCKTRER